MLLMGWLWRSFVVRIFFFVLVLIFLKKLDGADWLLVRLWVELWQCHSRFSLPILCSRLIGVELADTLVWKGFWSGDANWRYGWFSLQLWCVSLFWTSNDDGCGSTFVERFDKNVFNMDRLDLEFSLKSIRDEQQIGAALSIPIFNN